MTIPINAQQATSTWGAEACYLAFSTDGTSPLTAASTNNPFPVSASMAASELHIGEVGSPLDVITLTPTTSASPDYSIGDAVGGKQTITSAVRVSGGKAILHSIYIVDKDNQKQPLTILFFDSDPSAATITDNSAFAMSTDVTKCIAKVDVLASDYTTIDSQGHVTLRGLNIVVKASGTANLFAAVIAGGTINASSTSFIIFKYGFLQG